MYRTCDAVEKNILLWFWIFYRNHNVTSCIHYSQSVFTVIFLLSYTFSAYWRKNHPNTTFVFYCMAHWPKPRERESIWAFRCQCDHLQVFQRIYNLPFNYNWATNNPSPTDMNLSYAIKKDYTYGSTIILINQNGKWTRPYRTAFHIKKIWKYFQNIFEKGFSSAD